MNHNGHDYKFLENIVEDTRCEIISAKHDLVYELYIFFNLYFSYTLKII